MNTLKSRSSPVQPQSSTAGHWNTCGLSTLLKGTLAVATEKEFTLLNSGILTQNLLVTTRLF